MIISTNLSAIFTNAQLNKTSNKISDSMEKLSSGYKINSSADDSVGMAMSETLRLQLRGLERAEQNASDGVSVIETAEGALNEVNSILSRMRELAVQGANDTYTDEDRVNLQSEFDSLSEEIDRISRDTEFNGSTLLNGSLQRSNYCYDVDAAGDTTLTNDIDLLYFSDDTDAGNYGLTYYSFLNATTGEYEMDSSTITLAGDFVNANCTVSDVSDNIITITGDDGFYMEISVEEDLASIADSANPQSSEIEILDMGTMTIQVGGKEGQTVDLTVPEVTSKTLGIENVDLTTDDGCEAAIDAIDSAVNRVLAIRGTLGANENRFDSTISSLSVSQETTTNAISRVIDLDMAEEMTTYTSLSVIQQAGISMLSQANQLPEKVLQLLQ